MNNKTHASGVGNIIGYVIGLILTFAAAWLVLKSSLATSIKWTIISIFAIIQAGLQLFMFMHMSEGEDRDTKVVHTIYAIFMGIVVVFGSIWVMTAGHPIG